jgi:FAD/FMN-containing dehydrogenase
MEKVLVQTNWAAKNLAGWGRYPRIDTWVARPERLSEVQQALKDRDGKPVLGFGLGRSYGDAALVRDGRVISTQRLNRMLDFDPETGWLRVEAGVSLKEIIDTFLPRGFFPPVVPGTQFVTVGGAVGCNIHGKNHHIDGAFGDHVRRLELLTASGEIVICDRETEPELFWATVGGMGMTGLILSLEVRLQRVHNAAIAMESVRVNNLDEFFEVSDQSASFTHTVSWVDCVKQGASMGRGIFMRGRHAMPGEDFEPSPLDMVAEGVQKLVNGKAFESNIWLNKATIRMFNEAFFRKTPAGTTRANVHYVPFFFPLDAVENWNYLYGSRGFLQYQMVVADREAVRDILSIISKSGLASFLAVIKDFGEADHGGLSFPTPGTTLALDFPNFGRPLFQMLDRLDDIVLEAGGRVYLGKDARLPREKFQKMYPEWERWKAVRDLWDPKHVFQSELGRRLGLVGDL